MDPCNTGHVDAAAVVVGRSVAVNATPLPARTVPEAAADGESLLLLMPLPLPFTTARRLPWTRGDGDDDMTAGRDDRAAARLHAPHLKHAEKRNPGKRYCILHNVYNNSNNNNNN